MNDLAEWNYYMACGTGADACERFWFPWVYFINEIILQLKCVYGCYCFITAVELEISIRVLCRPMGL